MPAPFSGGCRCGAQRYTCNAEPLNSLYCHCRDCQFASGGGFSTLVIAPRQTVEFNREQLGSYAVPGESGAQVTRLFCTKCGTPMFSEPELMSALLIIKAATLDDPGWLRPSAHIYTDSAQPWALAEDGLPRHAKFPPQ